MLMMALLVIQEMINLNDQSPNPKILKNLTRTQEMRLRSQPANPGTRVRVAMRE